MDEGNPCYCRQIVGTDDRETNGVGWLRERGRRRKEYCSTDTGGMEEVLERSVRVAGGSLRRLP